MPLLTMGVGLLLGLFGCPSPMYLTGVTPEYKLDIYVWHWGKISILEKSLG